MCAQDVLSIVRTVFRSMYVHTAQNEQQMECSYIRVLRLALQILYWQILRPHHLISALLYHQLLDSERGIDRQPRRSQALCVIGFIFSSVARHLSQSAACAEKGAAEILTPIATLFGNRILFANTLSSAAQGIGGPNNPENAPNNFHNDNVQRGRIRPIWHRGDFESRRISHIRQEQNHHHFESVLSGRSRARLSKPSQIHAGHYLRHCNLATKKGTPNVWMTCSQRKAIAKSILPSSRGSLKPVGIVHIWNGSQEGFTLNDTSFGLSINRSIHVRRE